MPEAWRVDFEKLVVPSSSQFHDALNQADHQRHSGAISVRCAKTAGRFATISPVFHDPGFPQPAEISTEAQLENSAKIHRKARQFMTTIRIAVGSARRPKVNAVEEAAAIFVPHFGAGIRCEVNGYEVESGVSHTPTSREELMRGARQRADTLQQKLRHEQIAGDFFVGVEGGLDVVVEDGHRRVFLESWAYVCDQQRGHFGCSGCIELPAPLAEKVLLQGVELATAIDEFAGSVGIRDGQGAWGVLSQNLISRQDSFRVAVIAGFAPFYNAAMYRTAAAAAR